MKLLNLALKVLVFYSFLWIPSFTSAQDIEAEVNVKLSASDQKKINKANEQTVKGDQILVKTLYPGDKQVLDMLNMGETKSVRNFIGNRVDADECYRDANSQKFEVYAQNCKTVYSKITGDQNLLTPVVKSEANAIAIFKDALATRKKLEKMSKLKERLPLIFEAEDKEKQAIDLIQKVLYVYLKHPEPYNKNWFPSDNQEPAEQNVPKTVTPELSNNDTVKTQPVSVKKDSAINHDIQYTNTNANNTSVYNYNNNEKPAYKPEPSINSKTENLTSDSSIYKMANVNEQQVDSFNLFLQKKYPGNYESYLLNFRDLDYSNIQSLRDAWYQYRYGLPEDSVMLIAEINERNNIKSQKDTAAVLVANNTELKENPLTQNNNSAQTDTQKVQNTTTINKAKNIKTPEIPVVVYQNNIHEKEANASTKHIKTTNKQITLQKEKNNQVTQNYNNETVSSGEKPEVSTKTTGGNTNIATGFNYKIQVAACRVKIPANELSGIYPETDKITETYEDGWYKYTIGNFKTYNEARTLRNQSSVSGAFVVAYINGKRVSVTTMITEPGSNSNINESGMDPNKIEFRVQILASKILMQNSVIKNIYNGPLTVDLIQEEGLYKYSLRAGKKLADAITLAKTLNIPGAFIVAYYNNQKINLYTAIKLTRNL
jgi:hypothetical protein